MKSKLWQFAFLLFTAIGFSQSVTVSGKVFDSSTRSPLLGASVSVKNAGLATTTSDGSFTVSNVEVGSTLTFSFYGYTSENFVVTKNQTITISLKQDNKSIEEVVVVGYSSKKRKDVTGAISYVSSKTIEQLKPIQAAQALQGTVSGVVVTTGSGAPGSGFNIRIRGISSNTNSEPLYLIDGYQGDINLLNPSDIESITVLKDAQASVYGAKGANGVVLVTTKQGKKNQRTKVSFNTYFGQQETSKKINLLNATEYALLLNESYANGGQPLPYPNVSGLGKGTNWQNEVFKKASIINNDFSISGGSEKIVYTFSGSKIKQDGIVGLEKSGFDRSNARISLGVDLSTKINLSTNLYYTDYNRQGLNENGLGSVLFNAINTPSTLTPYDSNGDYTLVPSTAGFGNEVINPLAQIENTYNSYNQKKINGNFVLQYKPISNFKITSRYGFNSANSVSKSFSKQISYGGLKVFNVDRSSVSQNAIRFSDYTFDLFGEYEKVFFENHKVKLTAGGTLYEEKSEGLYGTGYDVPYNSWDYADIQLANGTPPPGEITSGSYKSAPYKRPSLFATLDYDFKEKYLLTLILRRDQSSRFPTENSVAYFKSILGGWIVSQEDFFKKDGFVNFLKLRGSYGTLGNDVAGNGDFRSLLVTSTYVIDNTLTNGLAPGKIPNNKIKWETDTKLDLGFDLRMLNNQVEITADYFNDTRKDLLVGGIPISGINGGYAPGSGAPTVNAGTVRNQGLELSLNYKNDKNKLKYNLGFNITTIDNEVLEVNNSTGYIEAGSFGVGQSLQPTRMVVGQSIGVFYGLQADGVFQNQAEIDAHPSQTGLGSVSAPGDIKFKDVNGDGVINFSDRTYIGKQIADYTLGFNVNLNYKNLDFVAYAYASIGNDLIRNYERTENKLNKLDYVLDRWTGEGTSNTVPRVTTGATNNNLFSSYFVEDASFLRIQNIQLGYSLPTRAIEKIGISKIRLYASVNNAFTFSKYRGFDPTANTGDPIAGGIDYGFYPAPRTYSFGLNVNF
jgi:TonB-linked SusC/RagA family outer membrane protein